MNSIIFKSVKSEYKLNRDKIVAERLHNGNIEFLTTVGVFVCKGVRDADDVFAKIHNVWSFASKGVDEYESYDNWQDNEHRYRNQCDCIEFIPCTNMPVVNNDNWGSRRC